MPDQATRPAQPGPKRTIIAGYELLEPMAKGPLGTIYRARHVKSGRMVVFRGFHRPADADEAHWQAAVQRFRDALAGHAKIDDHINIQDLIESGETHGLYYVVTEYFEGRTLGDLLAEKGRLTLAEALPIFEQVAAAIDFAAAHGQSHGDLTPANVLILADGQVRVINHGLAHTRNKLGSPYLAPEQLTGADGDVASDVYALGALLYEALSGHPPFAGDTPEAVCHAISAHSPVPIPDLPDQVNAVLLKLLSKVPALRYRHATAAIKDLAAGRAPRDDAEPRHAGQPPPPWHPAAYQPEPSLHHYDLSGHDFVAAHRRLVAERAFLRVQGTLYKIAFAALLLAFVANALQHHESFRYARVVALTGQPQWIAPDGPRPLLLHNAIDGAVECQVRTPADSTLVLEVTGARIKLLPRTILTIRRLGYHRGRIRRFRLEQGRIVARVDRMPRHGSRFEVAYGPFAVSVRGTLFDVSGYGPAVRVAAAEGEVAVDSGSASETVSANQMLRATAGDPLGEPVSIDPALLEQIQREVDLAIDRAVGEKLAELAGELGESTVVASLEGLKSLLGLQPTELVGTALDDVEALSKARIALGALAMHLLMEEMEAPPDLTLDTLEELGIDRQERRRLLSCFDGHKLLKYQRTGPEQFIIEARAADSSTTLLRCENGKVEMVREDAETDDTLGDL